MLRVLVLIWAAVACSGPADCLETNVALNGVATQSSDYTINNVATKAIDGNTNSIFSQNSCSCTTYQTNPWWKVDLLRVFSVSSVTITNRGDCCSDRINGAEIRIGNSWENNGNNNPRCAVISSIPLGGSSTFSCNGMRGRYVNVYLPRTDLLTICEVVVTASPMVENIALKGRATQSSQYDMFGSADKAVDGNRQAVYGDGSCSHTRPQTNPWWRLDLLDEYRVYSVSITNRQDSGAERISGAEIRIGKSKDNNGNSNPVCAEVSTIPAGATNTFQCNGIEGRYINLVIPGSGKILALCEVEVDATPLEYRGI
ncbi:fucolectin-3-like [Scleropages formosus]|uniref:Fucolectin-4-like n=1 Tax=Scleropages formosus TaxID=113540 RepID=A0A8C9REG4_SCLFO|nr:fucolectin-3-like [Scleropages formosus]